MVELDERHLGAYLLSIDKKLAAAGRKDWSCLNDAEQTTLTAYLFALDVTNGGFEKFFLTRGDRWRETLHAIKTVGAEHLARLFEQALTAFPDKVPATDEFTRYEQLMAAGALGDGHLWKLSSEYCDLQSASAENCLYQRLTAFAMNQMARDE